MANVDWIIIKNEYINGNISYRKLAEKYHIQFSTLRDRAIKEKWHDSRGTQRNKIVTTTEQKAVEIAVKNEINRIEKMLKIGDTAQEQIQLALSQLNKYMTPSGEIIESILVDVDRLRKLVSALKDIKDIVRYDKSTDNSDMLQKLIEGYREI